MVVGQERVGGQEEEGDGGGIGDLVAGQEAERIQRDLVVGQEGQGGTVGVQATWWLDKRVGGTVGYPCLAGGTGRVGTEGV